MSQNFNKKEIIKETIFRAGRELKEELKNIKSLFMSGIFSLFSGLSTREFIILSKIEKEKESWLNYIGKLPEGLTAIVVGLFSFLVILFLIRFVKICPQVAVDLHEKECENCPKEKELLEVQQKMEEMKEKIQVKNNRISELNENIHDFIKYLSSVAHSTIHQIRDAVNPEYFVDDFNFKKEIVYVLEMCRRYFQMRYGYHVSRSMFTTSIMEVDNLTSPESMVTAYYCNDVLPERKKHRSLVKAGAGNVAGKFLQIQQYKINNVPFDDDLEPVIWTIDDLDFSSFVRENKKKIEDPKYIKRIEKKKKEMYDKGISSPFLVKNHLQGCINIDILSKREKHFSGFQEEDKETMKFFGDACALLYHVHIIRGQLANLKGNETIVDIQGEEEKIISQLSEIMEKKKELI